MFDTVILSKPSANNDEETKVNPETDYFRDYLINNLLKLCRYDKGTVLQLLEGDETIMDNQKYHNETLSEDMLKFKIFDFSQQQINSLRQLIKKACISNSTQIKSQANDFTCILTNQS